MQEPITHRLTEDDWYRGEPVEANPISKPVTPDRVMPGHYSGLAVEGVPDGLPPTGLTSFEFYIYYPAVNGLRQTDGREICKAVERLVARMVADRTWRHDFGGRDNATREDRQQHGPKVKIEEEEPEATASTAVEPVEQ
ncbi:hypothetical protein N0V82_001292 [Gnomoniopsis sp. IMI 355080]|nr:hypothetical protein N0V82_001292 [Gnomoniopsis sp. IMI 355080]